MRRVVPIMERSTVSGPGEGGGIVLVCDGKNWRTR